jgi:selenocysteine-specific elongation factor
MIVGTAGHIDHGKTSLVKALTGVDADRLKEEKARGITLDLGFAYTPQATGGMLGFVDVPGHEKLVHNMLAGATGIDFVLLVIAADDGPMPQTREHLAILDLLGIDRGAVALTKIDRVPAPRVDTAAREIRSLLSGTGLAESPVFPLSAISGEGVSPLRAHLEQAAGAASPRAASGHFRLTVDRSFTLAGAGTVVTGTVCSGAAQVGDALVVSPAGIEVRVRSIHAQNRPATYARAGERCALNLAGAQFDKDSVRRGDWLLAGQLHAPTQRFDALCRILASEEKPLRHWTPVHLHTGACDVTARIAVLEGMAIDPGGSALVQIVSDRPLSVLHGDRFIVRDQSATRTLGGGQALDPFAPVRNRRTAVRLAALRAMQETEPVAALLHALEASPGGVDLAQFAVARNIRLDEAQTVWQKVPMRIVPAPAAAGFSPSRWGVLKADVLNRLATEHREAPEFLGPDRARLHRMSAPALARPVFDALLDDLLQEGQIAQSGPWLHLPEHKVRLTPDEERQWLRVLPMLTQSPLHPPRVRDIAREVTTPENDVRQLLRRVARTGEVYLVAHDHYFTKDAVAELGSIVRDLAQTRGCVRASEFRDRVAVGRKLAIQILEFFDRIGYTRRTGDEHRLRQ